LLLLLPLSLPLLLLLLLLHLQPLHSLASCWHSRRHQRQQYSPHQRMLLLRCPAPEDLLGHPHKVFVLDVSRHTESACKQYSSTVEAHMPTDCRCHNYRWFARLLEHHMQGLSD
jgi:hypothetical protein